MLKDSTSVKCISLKNISGECTGNNNCNTAANLICVGYCKVKIKHNT